MKQKIILVVDWNISKDNFWLKQELEKNEFKVVYFGLVAFNKSDLTIKWRKLLLWTKYLFTALFILLKSKKNDIILSWNFVLGAWIGFFSRIFFLNRKIISLNLIAHEKGSLNTLIRKLIYNQAFKNPNFFTTVNTKELIGVYEKYFIAKDNKYFLLEDPYDPESDISDFLPIKTFVFAGGEAARDWELFFEAAQKLPEIPFKIIVRKKYFDIDFELPNVEIEYDTSIEFFYKKMKESSLVVLPLNSVAPSGILVLHRAALLSKPIIATETSITNTYITNNENGILIPMHNVDDLVLGIKKLFENQDLCKEFATKLHEKTLIEFSPIKYTQKLIDILKDLNWVSK